MTTKTTQATNESEPRPRPKLGLRYGGPPSQRPMPQVGGGR